MARNGERAGVLLANLGTPDAPTAPALKRYLREFLSDPRVIELPRWKWRPILELFVLTTRPAKSAEAYRTVWKPGGSPLLLIGRRQASRLAEALARRFRDPVPVALAMRYGRPSIEDGIGELERAGCRRILVLPLYPQYAAATTASTFDAAFDALRRRRDVPAVRTVRAYHEDPAYIDALVASFREAWTRGGEPRRLLLSFHGIPKRYADAGDPYPDHCRRTTELVREALGWGDDRVFMSYQSRFGKEEWLKPYTDETLEAWGNEKLESVDVACPGFSADCLETLEEIDGLNREAFEEAGGGRYRYIRALNVRTAHIEALADVCARNLEGWAVPRAR